MRRESVSPEFAFVIVAIGEAYKNLKKPYSTENQYVTGFPTARMEAVTFFHSDWFLTLCEAVGMNGESIRRQYRIPSPSDSCGCYSCRTDMTPEARVVSEDNESCRFIVGSRHHVFWLGDEIISIQPEQDGPTINAQEYLEAMDSHKQKETV